MISVQQTQNKANILNRIIVFIYGVISYVIFFVTLIYTAGFLGNIVVPKSIDSIPQLPLLSALIINGGLLGLFGIQHSVMARQGFKQWWTKFINKAAERSTYVLLSSLALMFLFWQWQPMGGVIWNIQNQVGQLMFWLLFGIGWLILFLSTFLINHFDLFGLRQVYLYLQGQEYTQLEFQTPWLYNYVRHPLYVGWLLIFWSTPNMTATHLVFALLTTIYILVAIQFEERDLINIHGETYATYRQRVPMLIPFMKKQYSLK
ncbi:isoprenylcysteine carboxylmethyltransferase family protein [Anabaena minutissima FACHB-250]|nr:isoprenylcysteine carboxylmethyltransferase family protein [Anabaena minutissima FACHB-250]